MGLLGTRSTFGSRVGHSNAAPLLLVAVCILLGLTGGCGTDSAAPADLVADAASTPLNSTTETDGASQQDGAVNQPDAGRFGAKGTRFAKDPARSWPSTDAGVGTDTGISQVAALSDPDAAVSQPGDPKPCPDLLPEPDDAATAAVATPMAVCTWDSGLTAELAAGNTAPLAVTLGRKADSPSGAFEPLQTGDWLGLHHGMQGSFHAYLAFRVTLPASSGANHKLLFDAWLADGCSVVAGGTPPQIWLWPVADTPGQWGNTENGDPGTLLYFELPSAEASKFCGKWVTLHVRVLDPKTGAYGETSEQVRLFDTLP